MAKKRKRQQQEAPVEFVEFEVGRCSTITSLHLFLNCFIKSVSAVRELLRKNAMMVNPRNCIGYDAL
jgi:hypothetical protein